MPYDPIEYAKGKEVLVRVHHIEKTYHRGAEVTHALRNISLEIYRGEYICIMGPSGSGKSTLFNMIGALDTPTAGRIFIDEVDMAQLKASELAFLRCRKISYVFQQFNLNQVMTALENVTLPMIFAGKNPEDARKKGMRLLERVGLEKRWNHRPKEMSGGQQQRVAIARSLANDPSLILCDEPTANLDFKTGKDVHNLLYDLNKNDGVTVVCVTHDHNMLTVSDRMLWLSDGLIDRIELSAEVDIRRAQIARKDGQELKV